MTITNLLTEKKLRKKVYFTTFVLFVVSLLSRIPVIGVNENFMKALFQDADIFNFMDALTGGSWGQMSIAGFGITSHITATIVIQLMAIVFPKIEKIRQDGERGRKRIEKIEFILAMAITVAGSISLAIAYGNDGLFEEYNLFYVSLAVCSWFIGSLIVIRLAQLVEEKGIGNGISLVLCFNILSRIPNNVLSYVSETASGKDMRTAVVWVGGLILALFVFYFISIYLQCGMLNIPIKQTRKDASVMNHDGRIPISVNIASVLPVIYASTIVILPTVFVKVLKLETNETADAVLSALTSENWYQPTAWYHIAGFAFYVLMIIGFSTFASGLSFSSAEIANTMRKNGDIIPNVQPGRDTVAFLERRRKVLSYVNVIFLLFISVVPDFMCTRLGIECFAFLGTSLIIVISTLFDSALRIRAASIHNDKIFRLFGKRRKAA